MYTDVVNQGTPDRSPKSLEGWSKNSRGRTSMTKRMDQWRFPLNPSVTEVFAIPVDGDAD
jgi:hypothetical protein